MIEFPPGCPNFQMPRPHKGVVYADADGRIYLMRDGQVLPLWAPDAARHEPKDAE